MCWLDFPFTHNIDGQIFSPSSHLAHVVLDKIPTVIIDSPFSWDAVLAAGIAGFIPGAIAYMAIKNGNALARMQLKAQSQTKINDEIRVAAASYVTAINYISTDYSVWIKDVIERNITTPSKEMMPDYLIDSIFRAESSKNLLTLLITPDDEGNALLKEMGKAQIALDPFLSAEASYKDVLKLRTAVNNFMYACHAYFLRS